MTPFLTMTHITIPIQLQTVNAAQWAGTNRWCCLTERLKWIKRKTP